MMDSRYPELFIRVWNENTAFSTLTHSARIEPVFWIPQQDEFGSYVSHRNQNFRNSSFSAELDMIIAHMHMHLLQRTLTVKISYSCNPCYINTPTTTNLLLRFRILLAHWIDNHVHEYIPTSICNQHNCTYKLVQQSQKWHIHTHITQSVYSETKS